MKFILLKKVDEEGTRRQTRVKELKPMLQAPDLFLTHNKEFPEEIPMGILGLFNLNNLWEIK